MPLSRRAVEAAVAAACLLLTYLVVFAPAALAVTSGQVWSSPSVLEPNANGFDLDAYEHELVALPGGGAAVVWGVGSTLFGAIRTPDTTSFGLATTIATNGDFVPNFPDDAPSLAVGPSGELLVAYGVPTNATSTRVIDIATRAADATSWSAPVAVSGAGDVPDQAQVAYGPDGTAAVVWSGDSGIWASVRAPNLSSWSAPTVVSDTIQANVVPAEKDPVVAISDSGEVTVAWSAIDTTNADASYRMRSSTLASGSWSTPVWLSGAGIATFNAQLITGTDNTITAAWIGNGINTATYALSGWTAPETLASDANQVAIAAEANGALIALIGGMTGNNYYLRSEDYTPANGWSAPTDVTPNTDNASLYSPNVRVGAGGVITAGWVSCDQTTCTIDVSDQAANGDSWSIPTVATPADNNPADMQMVEDPDNRLTAVYNDAAAVQSIRTEGIYSLRSVVTLGDPGAFVSLAPSRVLDTRSGNGVAAGAVPAGHSVAVQVTGRGGVPSSGVAAVVLNVTVTQPTSVGYVTVFGAGASRPNASNLNFSRAQTIPNLVVTPVGTGGKVDLYNGSSGTVQLIADVSGYYLAGAPSMPGAFVSLAPSRVLDTRSGNGVAAGAVPAGHSVAVQVTGRGGVPSSGVAAVVLNVTVTQPTSVGYVTVFGAGASRPNASNLNFSRAQTIPNLVVTPVGTGGKVDLYNGSSGTVQLIADVSGYYLAG